MEIKQYVNEIERNIPVIANVDVLICGGGIAGVAAAYSAARNNYKVLLIERYGYLGGMVTAGLVITTPPFNNGINIEILRRLNNWEAYGETKIDDSKWPPMIPFDPEIFKYELLKMLIERNVGLLFHTYIVQSIIEEDSIKGIIVENKSGRQAILSKIVVDATGDGDVAAFSKVPYETDKEPLPVTMMFNMVGVDVEQAIAEIGSLNNLRDPIKKAKEKNDLIFDLGLDFISTCPGVSSRELCHPGEISVHGGNLFNIDALNGQELSKAEIITREGVMKLAEFLKRNVQGFERSRIEYTAAQVGVRMTRRILGKISPSLHEIDNQKFEDTIAKPYTNRETRVPYRSIVPNNVENLLVAGRCISVEPDAMIELRSIPPCFATGQAAGTAAALAIKENTTPRELNITLLQDTLIRDGMKLD